MRKGIWLRMTFSFGGQKVIQKELVRRIFDEIDGLTQLVSTINKGGVVHSSTEVLPAIQEHLKHRIARLSGYEISEILR